MNNYNLSGKVAVITGASDGLGEQFALALSESGANVILGSRRIEKLIEIAERIETEFKVRAIPVKTDVMNENEICTLVQQSKAEFDRLDIMINNVGNYLSKPLIEQSLEDWDYVLRLNLTSAFLGSREAAKIMIPQQSGVIINMSSVFGFSTTRFPVCSYYAAKAGVIGLTKALAVELGPYNIRVNAIAPGFFPTKQSIDAMTDEVIRSTVIEPRTALPFLAKKEWIRGAVCFLASDDAKYITGHVLSVDGGWSAF